DGIRDKLVTGVQTCALPIFPRHYWLHRRPRRHYRNESVAQVLFETAGDHRRSRCVSPPVDRTAGCCWSSACVSFKPCLSRRPFSEFAKRICSPLRLLRGESFWFSSNRPFNNSPLDRSSDAGSLDQAG